MSKPTVPTEPIDAEIDAVIREIDGCQSRGEWTTIDSLLAATDPTALKLEVALAVLSMTFAERTRFPSRAEFWKRLHRYLVLSRGKRAAEELMAGLMPTPVPTDPPTPVRRDTMDDLSGMSVAELCQLLMNRTLASVTENCFVVPHRDSWKADTNPIIAELERRTAKPSEELSHIGIVRLPTG